MLSLTNIASFWHCAFVYLDEIGLKKVIKLQLLQLSSCGFKLTRELCMSLFIKFRFYYKEVAHVTLGARKPEVRRAGWPAGNSSKSWCGHLVSVLWRIPSSLGGCSLVPWIVYPYNKVTCMFSFVIIDQIKRISKLHEEKAERIKYQVLF